MVVNIILDLILSIRENSNDTLGMPTTNKQREHFKVACTLAGLDTIHHPSCNSSFSFTTSKFINLIFMRGK
jgi:hypothetical protein